MKLLFLTPGTGSYYCGVCMRDNALVRQLRLMGHDAVLLPLYLPLTLEEEAASPGAPVFFGGLSVYLQQKFAWFRKAPRWVDRILDHPWVLSRLGRFSGMTQGPEIGALTLSMLQGEEGAQSREVEKLVGWMESGEKPDVVWLSTGLLVGVARRIREVLGVPVLCSFQGEDSFLDALPEPWRTRCWEEAGRRCAELQAMVAPSRYFAEKMRARLGLAEGSVRVVPNGMSLEGYGDGAAAGIRGGAPTVGYLARLIPGKGLGVVVDAFLVLKKRGRVPGVRLACAGTMISGDAAFLEQQKERIRAAGWEGDADFLPNVTKEEKVAFLRGLTLLSVPASYGEAFGLYLIEAMACGVPVVQPRTAAFPEIVEATGGGVLVDEGTPEALALAWEKLLLDPERARRLGHAGREAVHRSYTMEVMAERFVAMAEEVSDSGAVG
ncbi:MAG: hypothetical protein RLZZ399_2809 [Verrucomicrobiota bacterium]|jgi:glycosyltransferase involved in cell wall biosynthesis